MTFPNEDDVMAFETCPKCGQKHAQYKAEGNDLLLTCLCGYLQVVYTENEETGMTITKSVPKNQVQMPRKDTKLHKCLLAVANMHPTIVTTKQVADKCGGTSSDVASQLMVLQHKGLVSKVVNNRGVTGGSTWQITEFVIKELKLARRAT